LLILPAALLATALLATALLTAALLPAACLATALLTAALLIWHAGRHLFRGLVDQSLKSLSPRITSLREQCLGGVGLPPFKYRSFVVNDQDACDIVQVDQVLRQADLHTLCHKFCKPVDEVKLRKCFLHIAIRHNI
jgi:hypothetical protein